MSIQHVRAREGEREKSEKEGEGEKVSLFSTIEAWHVRMLWLLIDFEANLMTESRRSLSDICGFRAGAWDSF